MSLDPLEASGTMKNITKIEMNKVNTDEVAPMSHPLNLKQFMRDDKITEINNRDEYQNKNKNTQDGYYKVPKIID